MASRWVAVPLLAALLFGACAGDDHEPTAVSTTPHSAPFRLADADRTTTTTTPTAPRIRAVRASRRASAPRVAVAPESAPVPVELGECGMWGYKSRARSDECWGPIIAAYGDWNTATMLRILYCESTGNPWVVNASNHVGLFQIKNSHTKGDGPGNIAHAHAMWAKSGTKPWAQCGG